MRAPRGRESSVSMIHGAPVAAKKLTGEGYSMGRGVPPFTVQIGLRHDLGNSAGIETDASKLERNISVVAGPGHA